MTKYLCPVCVQYFTRSAGAGRPRTYCSAACQLKQNRERMAELADARRVGPKKLPAGSGPSRDERWSMICELKAQPCVDCDGTFHCVAMDFDHRDPALKLFTISRGLMTSMDALLAEIAKCDLVCANCHRVRTHIKRGNAGRDRSPKS